MRSRTARELTARLAEQFVNGRNCGVPLFFIKTPDPAHTVDVLRDVAKDSPQVRWDVINGYLPLNEAGKEAIQQVMSKHAVDDPDLLDDSEDAPKLASGCAVTAAVTANDFPKATILFQLMAHKYLDNPSYLQAVWNLRDDFKSSERTLVMLGQIADLPCELAGDVIVLDEPLPDDEQLRDIVLETIECIEEADRNFIITDETVYRVAATMRGCTAFSAEQLAAMAIRSDGFDTPTLREHARKAIESRPGLSIDVGGETFSDIGGLEQIKKFGTMLFDGPRPPRIVVRIEEIEKATAGSKGDTSGTSTDILQVLLSEMEDNGWTGILAYGAPGAGKSLFSKSLANTHEALAMRLDINACKGSLVGQSEQQIRDAMKVIKTIGLNDVFFVASMNSMDIPPELRRRFRAGVWFFDTPDEAERKAIWKINRAKYGVDEAEPSADEDGLTGADIRNVCEMSHSLNCTLLEAKEYTVSLKDSAPEALNASRKSASGRYLSASYPGRYQRPVAVKDTDGAAVKPKRKLSVKN